MDRADDSEFRRKPGNCRTGMFVQTLRLVEVRRKHALKDRKSVWLSPLRGRWHI